MDKYSSQHSTTSQKIVKLVNTALAQNERVGISEMLREIAQAVDAQGCTFWQLAPYSRLDDDPPSGKLYVLAEWFEGNKSYCVQEVSNQSAVYKAIQNRCPITVDVAKDQLLDRDPKFLEERGVRYFCSVPIRSLDGKEYGALNAYRTTGAQFNSTELQELEELAELAPPLYKIITEQISNQLFLKLNQCLQEGNRSETSTNLREKELISIAEKVCKVVADVFQAFEVSLFLNNYRDTSSNTYELVATTWPHDQESAFTKRIYHPLEGLTGWILAKKLPIRVFDLTHFESEREYLQSLYPDLSWGDTLHIEENVRKFLKITEQNKLPPLSYMAAPVIVQGQILGVIRCCTAIHHPYFFTERDVKILKLVADQIGQTWSNWLSQYKIKEENDFWQRFVLNITNLHQLMRRQLDRKTLNESEVFQSILEILRNVITNAGILDVALYDPEHHELYFKEVYGEAWKQGSPEEVYRRRTQRIPIDAPPTSGSAYVWETNETCIFENTKDPYYYPDEIFPGSCSIIAPISVASEKFGVLHIRRVSKRSFPKNAKDVAVLLGQQLGLYLYSGKIIRELDDLTVEQTQIYENFAHELKSPILQLRARARELSLNSYDQSLMALRGLASKAKKVSQALGLFANLAHGKQINPKLTLLTEDYLIKTLIEAAVDQESTLDPAKGLHFKVEPHYFHEAFDKLREQKRYIEVDKDLLFQALNNLLDNAAKYSYKQTTVDIFGGLINRGRYFHISVRNRGLPITDIESIKCKERGWRSKSAGAVTGEGSGIGLWIVDHIMRAHGGELVIIPTTDTNETEVKLIFPVKM